MVYFLPIIPAVDGGPGDSLLGMLLVANLFVNAIPCVLTALALWRTAYWRGIRRPWLALIPVADLWVLGSLSDRYHKQVRGKAMQTHRTLPLLGIAALASVLMVSAVSWLLSIVNLGSGLTMTLEIIALYAAVALWGIFLVKRTIALCELYRGFASRRDGLYIALSILCPPLIPLFIFKCRW